MDAESIDTVAERATMCRVWEEAEGHLNEDVRRHARMARELQAEESAECAAAAAKKGAFKIRVWEDAEQHTTEAVRYDSHCLLRDQKCMRDLKPELSCRTGQVMSPESDERDTTVFEGWAIARGCVCPLETYNSFLMV